MKNGRGEENEAEEADEKKLPYCTTAPSAEHQRGAADDDPCDDGSAGTG